MSIQTAFTISYPQVMEAAGRVYFFVPRSGSLVEADAPAISLARALPQGGAVTEDELRGWIDGAEDPRAARATVEEFFTYQILLGAPLVQIERPAGPGVALPVKHLIASVAQACNLRCGYCYADFGHYRREPDMMQLETAKRYVDFLIENSGGSERVVYTFFGGEPLLNFPVIQETVRYARERGAGRRPAIQFGLTTNGTLLTGEMIEFLCGEGVEVTISVDGPAEVNDRLRPQPGGGGSYHLIEERVSPLLKRRPTPARVTVTSQNLDLGATFDALTALGFHEVGFSPVSSADPRYALTRADRERFVDALESLTRRTLEEIPSGHVLGFSNLLQLVRQIDQAERRDHPCGAGMSLIAGNAAGELYACHRLINDGEFALGSLAEGINRGAQADHLARLHVENKAPCARCWAQGLCGGGCYAVAKTETGAGDAVPFEHCDSIRRWYRAGIEAYVHLSVHHPEVLPRVVGASKTLENYQQAPV